MRNVYNAGWGNTSERGFAGTTMTPDLTNGSSLSFPSTAPFFLGAIMTQKTAGSTAVTPSSAAADGNTFIAFNANAATSVKLELTNGLVQNFTDANSFSMATRGLIWAVFNGAQVDETNTLLYKDVNGVLGLYGADPGAGFVAVPRAQIEYIRRNPQDYNSVQTISDSITQGTVTYASGITYRLVNLK